MHLHVKLKKNLFLFPHRSVLKISKNKLDIMINCFASNNKINETSCKSKDATQEGFISTGDISRIRDGKGINSCPCLCQAIKCTKNNDVLKNRDDFIRKVCSVTSSYFNQGDLAEKQFDQKGFIKDINLKKIVRELYFTDHQHYLMRSIVPYHFEFRKKR